MPAYLVRDFVNTGVTGYADDTTVHVKEKNLKYVTAKLEILADNMIQYCDKNELISNLDLSKTRDQSQNRKRYCTF